MVSTPLGENVRTDKGYKDCPIVGCGKKMCVDFVELPMPDFDVILVWTGFIVVMLLRIAVVGL